MKTLVITLSRADDEDTTRLMVAGPGITAFPAPLELADEFLLADVLRHVDRIAFGYSPGPCVKWFEREGEPGAAA